MREWLLAIVPGAADAWSALGPNASLYWLGLQALLLVPVLSWLWWRAFQWARGRRKVLGAWRTESQIRALMISLKADALNGRVLAPNEKLALREYENGRRFAVFKDKQFGA